MSIYPKLAASRSIAIREGTCFLLMPFARAMRPVHAAIKDVCGTLDIKCERADDIYSQRPIFSTILDSILSSEVIISDLTGKNPNVFYETGIAHSLRDPQSVILVAQALDDVPFDLRHLPIVLYRLDNIQKFELELEHRISRCRAATRGVNFATNYLFPLHFQPHDVKSFIDYAHEISESFFPSLAQCLRPKEIGDGEAISKKHIDDIIRNLVLVGEASNGRWKRISDYLKLEVLSTERHFDVTREACFAHLHQATVNQFDIRERDEDFFAAELCFRLIDRDLSKTRAINWLLQYLHNPRMGNIDVVRYKIETYIVESEDQDLNASLLALLSSEVPSVREIAADMIGHKSIPNAGKYLGNALALEENPYTARSIITALARQNAFESVEQIADWVTRHHHRWWKEPISITLRKVSEETIRKLEPKGGTLSKIQKMFSSEKSEKSE